MESSRKEACRRGLRAAAQVAALTGVIAASAGLSRAEPPRPLNAAEASGASEGSSESNQASSTADRVARMIRVPHGKDFCSTPSWGPPAPPAMRPSLFHRIGAPIPMDSDGGPAAGRAPAADQEAV